MHEGDPYQPGELTCHSWVGHPQNRNFNLDLFACDNEVAPASIDNRVQKFGTLYVDFKRADKVRSVENQVSILTE